MEHGYYGNTSTLINLSPYKFNSKGEMASLVMYVLPQPDSLRHHDNSLSLINNQIAALCARHQAGWTSNTA